MATMKVGTTLDASRYKRGIDEIKRENKSFGSGLSGIGDKIKTAFAVGAVIAFTRKIGQATMSLVNFGSKLTDMAVQADVNVESLQRLQAAAIEAGASEETLTNALSALRDAQGAVISGDKTMTDAFKELGLTIEEVAGMDTEQLFQAVGAALTASGNAADKFSAVGDVLGSRNARRLIEVLNLTSEGLDKVGNDVFRVSERNAQALDLMADRWGKFKRSVTAFFASGVAVAARGLFGEEEIDRRLESAEKMAEVEKESRQAALQKIEAEKERVAELEKAKQLEKDMTEEQKRREGVARQVEKIEQSVKVEIDTDQFRRIGGFAGSDV